jgi:hypothetical protein
MAKDNNDGKHNTWGHGSGSMVIPDSTKTDPGAKPSDSTFPDWVRKDMAYKEYGTPRQQYS